MTLPAVAYCWSGRHEAPALVPAALPALEAQGARADRRDVVNATQTPLFRFDGATFVYHRDAERLTGQWLAVFSLMQDGKWRTLREISDATGYPEASCSARLRDFRKPRFGGHLVERRHIENGLHTYRLVLG